MEQVADERAFAPEEPDPRTMRRTAMLSRPAPYLHALWVAALCALVSACSQYTGAAENVDSDAGSSASISAGGSSQVADTPTVPAEAVDAVWRLPSRFTGLSPSTQSFSVEVSRVECNSGVTGEVLAPTVEEGQRKVVVTFKVAPDEPGNEDCQANEWISSTVRLGEPLGQRSLYDGECQPAATAPGLCRPRGLRYPLARPR